MWARWIQLVGTVRYHLLRECFCRGCSFYFSLDGSLIGLVERFGSVAAPCRALPCLIRVTVQPLALETQVWRVVEPVRCPYTNQAWCRSLCLRLPVRRPCYFLTVSEA